MVAQEWWGRARMASVRRDLGLPLTDVDVDALRRHPSPPVLGEPGYETPDGP